MEENKMTTEEIMEQVATEELLKYVMENDIIDGKQAFKIIYNRVKARICSPENKAKRKKMLIRLAIVVAAVIGYEAYKNGVFSGAGVDTNINPDGLGADIPTEIPTDTMDSMDIHLEGVDNVIEF